MRRIVALIFIVLLLALVVSAFAGEEEKKMKADPAAELAKSVENGKNLFYDKSLGTSGMTCNSCHMEGGSKDGKMGEMTMPAFDNLGLEYPKYFGMADRVVTLSQVVNWCVVNPLKGKPLTWDDQRLTDLTAYVASVKKQAKAEKGQKK